MQYGTCSFWFLSLCAPPACLKSKNFSCPCVQTTHLIPISLAVLCSSQCHAAYRNLLILGTVTARRATSASAELSVGQCLLSVQTFKFHVKTAALESRRNLFAYAERLLRQFVVRRRVWRGHILLETSVCVSAMVLLFRIIAVVVDMEAGRRPNWATLRNCDWPKNCSQLYIDRYYNIQWSYVLKTPRVRIMHMACTVWVMSWVVDNVTSIYFPETNLCKGSSRKTIALLHV